MYKNLSILLLCIASLIIAPQVFAANNTTVVINELVINSEAFADEDGEFSDWIELYNPTNQPVDLSLFKLSDDSLLESPWIFPRGVTIGAGEYLVVFASGNNRNNAQQRLHTDFKMSVGETLTLINPAGAVIDRIDIGTIYKGQSLGRSPNGSGNFYIFKQPTPQAANHTAPLTPTPHFSLTGGFYNASQIVTLSSDLPGSQIYYTLFKGFNDLGEPVVESGSYSGPLTIDKTMSLRAYAVLPGFDPSAEVVHTYFMNVSHEGIPVVSVTTDRENLFDPLRGILVRGEGSQVPNYLQALENPTHVEFFEADGQRIFGQNGGIKLSGNSSRLQLPRPLAFVARASYNAPTKFEYKIFPGKSITSYNGFVLRNGSQDGSLVVRNRTPRGTFLRNNLMAELNRMLTVDFRDSRNTLVFINGEYWGIANLQENFNANYVVDNHPELTTEHVDLVKVVGREILATQLQRDNEMIVRDYFGRAVIEYENVSQEGQGVDDYLNLLSFMQSNNLSGAQQYAYVTDRLDIDSTVDYFVAQIYSGNTDWPDNNIRVWRDSTVSSNGLAGKWHYIYADSDATFNSLQNSTVNNTLEHAYLNSIEFKALLQNEEFKNKFLAKLAYCIRVKFTPEQVLNILNESYAQLNPFIESHLNKWWGGQFTKDQWEENVENIRRFILQRNQEIISATQQVLGVDLNHVSIESAVPFVPNIVINEVMGANDGSVRDDEGNSNSDWIELKNLSDRAVDIKNFTIADSSNEHRFTQSHVIAPGGYLVIWATGESNSANDLHVSFGISKSGETLTFKDVSGNILNRITTGVFTDNISQGRISDGSWSSLTLVTPGADNADSNHVPEVQDITNKEMMALTSADITITATDADHDTLTYSVSSNPSTFTHYAMNGNVLHLQPMLEDVGSYVLTVTVDDGHQHQVTKAFSLTVTNVQAQAAHIVINEVMGSNSSIISDENGNYSDWIELKNLGSTDVDLTGFQLIDSRPTPGATWTFPAGTRITAGGYLLVWATGLDTAPASGWTDVHANFSLSNSGETIVLKNAQGAVLSQVDTGAFISDVSRGRTPDAMGPWGELAHATPGVNNDDVALHGAGAHRTAVQETSKIISPRTGEAINPVGASVTWAGNEQHVSAYYIDMDVKPIIARGSGQVLSVSLPADSTQVNIPDVFLNQAQMYVTLWTKFESSQNWLRDDGNYSIQINENAHVAAPVFSHQDGLYAQPVAVNLTASAGNKIMYSLDGSELTSQLYKNSLIINQTTTVRARTVSSQGASKPVTRTFFINVNTNQLPIVSLVSDPNNFFDGYSGIYVDGRNPQKPNYLKGMQKPVEIAWYDPKDQVSVSHLTGTGVMQITGNAASKANPQKSLGVTVNQQAKSVLFTDKTKLRPASLILSNGDQDGFSTWLRNGLLATISQRLKMDYSASRPVVNYVNGQYWGIYLMREHIDQDYFKKNFDIAGNDVDLINMTGSEIQNLSLNKSYEEISRVMDMNDFIKKMIVEIYSANVDFIDQDNLLWRQRSKGNSQYAKSMLPQRGMNSKWRSVLTETHGFNLYPEKAGTDHDTLTYTMNHSRMLKKLMVNRDFRNLFINTFADLLNQDLSTHMLDADIINLQAVVANEMPNHFKRWPSLTVDQWENHVQQLQNFIQQRPALISNHLVNYFNLLGYIPVNVNNSKIVQGKVMVNSLTIHQTAWQGKYFSGVPMRITAVPNPGFKFDYWLINGQPHRLSTLTVNPENNMSIEVFFKKGNQLISGGVVTQTPLYHK